MAFKFIYLHENKLRQIKMYILYNGIPDSLENLKIIITRNKLPALKVIAK